QMIYRVGSPNDAVAYVETMNRIADSVQPLGETATALANSARGVDPVQQTAPANDPTDRYADYRRSRQPGGNRVPETSQARADQEPARDLPHTPAVSMRPQVIDPSAAREIRQPATRLQPKTITPTASASIEPSPKAPGNPP